ncbi:MAG: hypothetical protein IJJ98_08210 [Prevotella sp.]|nr:hypothetical protein [Prevotella sp.]
MNIAIASICSIALFVQPNRSYSLYKIFHLFVLFFFCIAPAIQYKNQVQLLSTVFEERDYIKASVYILFSLILFNICYFILYYVYNRKTGNSLIKKKRRKKRVKFYYIDKNAELKMVFISLFVFLLVFYMNRFSILSMLFRGGEYVSRVSMGRTYDLVITQFLRPMVMVVFLSVNLLGLKRKSIKFLLFLLFVLTDFPTGLPRFSVAAMYLPVILWNVPILRKKNMFVLVMIFGILVIFPFLNNFRRYSIGDTLSFGFDFSQFSQLHFDSFSEFMRVLSADIVTNGRQLLGALLFWIPRSVWPEKPIGSGAFVAREAELDFGNISMPYIGEGYINFGLLGVIAFVILIAYMSERVDSWYWTSVFNNKDRIIDNIGYFIVIALFLFILRGDLLSGTAYTCGFLSSYWFIRHWVLKKRIASS